VKIIGYSSTRTDSGAYNKPGIWHPVATLNGAPQRIKTMYDRRGHYYEEYSDLLDWLNYLVDNQRRLNRIFVQFEDDSIKCVYWYQQQGLCIKREELL